MKTRVAVLLVFTAAVSVSAQATGDRLVHGGREPHNWLTYSGAYSYDPETNLTFWGTGNPNPGWNGGPRNPGDNLYSDSVVRLRVARAQFAAAPRNVAGHRGIARRGQQRIMPPGGIQHRVLMGGGPAIMIDPQTGALSGASHYRKDGLAIGY